ncbi:unnamed protein product [Cuscuta europaea]|uniref:IST1-like protein n=1 Tax=Cuscuta europaea TaxID=41803 RepID=A0A9P1E6J5_CUSEU|nr:unnamed protein product [Cuscuta europaea]
MKKSSNFLRSSKDALTKSFNPAKCKTSLKLASSRLKILRNKKEVQVKQMKRELAQLLESRQNQTALIRVEHVVTEEKNIAAYDLIEIYCELIVARLPIIESQKNCPMDLKEAITSVVFASPRCGDVQELIDIRKHFTAKYGKEFINAAIELRPNSGVSRLLVEKLSAKVSDGQTKLKILAAIAEEQGVKWDPESFGESNIPPNDLLNGPSSFEKASKMYEDHPHFSGDASTNPIHNQGYYTSPNVSEMNSGSSMGIYNSASPQGSTSGKVYSSSSQLRETHSGHRSEARNSLSENETFNLDRQNWNMDFKDAASAAQAAAESAERASQAARAAARLSRDKEMGNSYASNNISEHTSKDSRDILLPSQSSMLQDQESEKMRNAFASSRSRVVITDDNIVHSLHEKDIWGKKRVKEVASQSGDSEPEDENFNCFADEKTTEERQNVPYSLHPTTFTHIDHIQNSGDQNFIYAASENLFINEEEGNPREVNVQMRSHGASSAISDEPNSDHDDNGEDTIFGTGPVYDDDDHQSTFDRSSPPELKLPTYPSTISDSWSPSMNMNDSPEKKTPTKQFFMEIHSPPKSPQNLRATENSEANIFFPTTFDDSDGGSSERDDVERSSTGEVIRMDRTQLSHYTSSNESMISGTKDDGNITQSGTDYGQELNYGKLTGGFRHKHMIPPPFMRAGQYSVPSIHKSKEVPLWEPESIPSHNIENSSSLEKSKVNSSHSDKDSDSSDDEFSQEILSFKDESDTHNKSSLRGSKAALFYSDSSDSEVPSPRKSSLTGKNQLGIQFSRRTKLSSVSSEMKNPSSSQVKPERPTNYGSGFVGEPAIHSGHETGEASGSSDNSLAGKNSKYASHVHPKLPDYDSLAARLRTLRMNQL